MSNQADPSGFGKFVPGFDFLQKLAQGGPAPMAGWLAPTLDAQALDKRLDELKAVQFWLDQNAAALKATIQALEVQKMTLAALKNMNVAPEASAVPPPEPSKAAAAMPAALQFWGALTQQFQQIASQAMQDVAARSAQAPPAAKPRNAAAAPAKKTARRRKTP